MNRNIDDNHKCTYDSVRDCPMYESVKEYWEFMGYNATADLVRELIAKQEGK